MRCHDSLGTVMLLASLVRPSVARDTDRLEHRVQPCLRGLVDSRCPRLVRSLTRRSCSLS